MENQILTSAGWRTSSELRSNNKSVETRGTAKNSSGGVSEGRHTACAPTWRTGFEHAAF